jgi:bacterioferritin-associated ferredoxin
MISMPDSVHLCDCRDLTVGDVRDVIRAEGLKSVEEVVESTEAGCCCESCISPEHEEGRNVYIVDLLEEVNG